MIGCGNWIVGVLVSGAALAVPARADLIFNFDDGARKARATLALSGSQLLITLENLGGQIKSPGEALTGLWFNAGGGVTFTGGTVVLSAGSFIVNPGAADADDGDGLDDDGGVSAEWGLEKGAEVTSLFAAFDTVVANAGLGDLVGTDDVFDGANLDVGENLDAPDSPDGINYAIIGLAGLTADATNKMKTEPLVAGGVVITLDFTGTLDLSSITEVGFNYGTDANAEIIPAPGAALLATLGLGTVGWLRRRL